MRAHPFLDLDGSGPLSYLRNERKIAKRTIVREDGIEIWSFKFGKDGALPGRRKMTRGEGTIYHSLKDGS